MEKSKYITLIASVFDVEASKLTYETQFKLLPEWDSIVALTLIATYDQEFGVTLDVNDISSAITISDLYGKISKKST
jgi:acyl carrier protein